MSVHMFRELYAYHRWANRRLFDVGTALGEELVSRDVGTQFSYTTVRRMFGHLYGADWIWLARWKGVATTTIPRGRVPDARLDPRAVGRPRARAAELRGWASGDRP